MVKNHQLDGDSSACSQKMVLSLVAKVVYKMFTFIQLAN